mgnify:CR=1 FL=1
MQLKTDATTPASQSALGLALLTAAMALPGADTAQAESAPERGLISLKYLDYQDSQRGRDRISVRAPSLMIMTPLAEVWSVSGTYTVDSVSGASPAYHSQQLTKMEDLRRAVDLGMTRYFSQGSLTVGANYSHESDYLSRGASLQGSISSESKNTTLNLGIGVSDDQITPSYGGIHETKKGTDFAIGLTQVITQQDIAQVNLGYSHGLGYFSDPYKLADERPRVRNHTTVLARWNHHFLRTEGTSHVSYRYYRDSWDIKAHTLTSDYAQPLPQGWTLTPLVRLHTQSAASFYLPTDPATAPGPTFPAFGATTYSEDQRLSAFGAVTLGIKVAKQLTPDWQVDLKLERYEQRAGWSLSGEGDRGLEPFSARSIQFGISRLF